MESGKVFLGVLAGVAIGAVLGILLAPEKGSVTRNQILGKSKGYADQLANQLEDFLKTASKNYEGALHTAEDLNSKGRAKLEEIVK